MSRIRGRIGLAALLSAASVVSAEILTLPAAASVVGVAPFYSDVRAFHTSYSATLEVTAIYRCFIGTCAAATRVFSLGPRESRAFDDIAVSLFGAPNTAGAVEFLHGGADGDLVVSSRLFSTSPTPTVGMFVPALKSSEAHPVTVLTSVRNGGAGAGFRVNIGFFNPNDVAVTPMVKVYDGGSLLGTAQLQPLALAARSGGQINDIFTRVGAGSHATSNATVVIESGGASLPLFTYAAVIDNATTDPIFVVGAEDRAPAAGPETILISVRAWDFSPGGPNSEPLRLQVGKTYTLVFRNMDAPGTPNPRHGFSGIGELGFPENDDISAGHDFVISGFTPQAFQRGTYPFSCTQNECGGDPEQHNGMLGLIVIE